MHVQRVFLERRERNDCKGFLVRCLERHRGRAPGLVRLAPGPRADAPPIARLEAWKPVLGRRRDQVVALVARELEERRGDLRAYHVQAEILGPGVAAPVAVEAGARLERAWGER